MWSITKDYQRHAAAETKNNFASQIKHNQNVKNKFPHTYAKETWMFQHLATHPAIEHITHEGIRVSHFIVSLPLKEST